jgi:hypothetical protein
MQITEIFFDTARHHIHLELTVVKNDVEYSVDAILDTGAPITEFSDQFLVFTGFMDAPENDITIMKGLQSQKYNMLLLPEIKICGHTLNNFTISVSRFEDSWGIDALIGLDFFRLFKVEIDYSNGKIITTRL